MTEMIIKGKAKAVRCPKTGFVIDHNFILDDMTEDEKYYLTKDHRRYIKYGTGDAHKPGIPESDDMF